MRPDRSPVEQWFMRRGIPHFIEGYAAGTDILTRAAPVLALVFVIEVIVLTFGERFDGLVQAIAALAALVLTLGAVALSQSIQVFLVAILTFVGLVGFGLVTVRETTLVAWLGEDAIAAGDRYVTGHIFGNRVLLSRQLIFVAGFVAAFAGLQFAVSVVNDAKYRSDFAEDMSVEVRQALAVRTAYLQTADSSDK